MTKYYAAFYYETSRGDRVLDVHNIPRAFDDADFSATANEIVGEVKGEPACSSDWVIITAVDRAQAFSCAQEMQGSWGEEMIGESIIHPWMPISGRNVITFEKSFDRPVEAPVPRISINEQLAVPVKNIQRHPLCAGLMRTMYGEAKLPRRVRPPAYDVLAR